LRNLTIDDGDRRARVTFQRANDKIDLSFNGELTQSTIERLFESFPIKAGALRGDIQVNAALAEPIRISARGQLSGSNLLLPFGTEKGVFEKFSIEGRGDSIVVRSADLRWGRSRLGISGKLNHEKEGLLVDLDVAADQLDWQELQHSFADDHSHPQSKKSAAISFPKLQGTIRLKADRFTFDRFNLSRLETTAVISPSGLRANIDQGAACGINIRGRVDVVDTVVGIDLQLSATDAPLEPTTVCLTNQENDVKGTYSLRARLAGRSDRDHLLPSLKGNFQFSARDGEFIRSPGIDATFDYLNATGDFKVAFPDLNRETFPYRFVSLRGKIEGNILFADEVNVESSLLNLSGQGKVDMERKQIDGKGLISVLKPVDQVVTRIPLVGSMLGGALVGIPVRVAGSLERPDVTYLSPADVGAELLSIPLRILGMPLGAMRLFIPSGKAQDKDVTP
jgi:hypothetical protein